MDRAAGLNLEALRSSVLAQVGRETDRAEAAARAERPEQLAAARRAVEEMHVEARAAGASDAARDAERLRRAAELDARTRVLASRRATYEALRERALAAVLETRSTPAYAELLARLAAAARADLGADAAIETDPGTDGGVLARQGARLVDYTLPALTDRCLQSLGAPVEAPWR